VLWKSPLFIVVLTGACCSSCSSFLWKVCDSLRLTARKLLGSLTLWGGLSAFVYLVVEGNGELTGGTSPAMSR